MSTTTGVPADGRLDWAPVATWGFIVVLLGFLAAHAPWPAAAELGARAALPTDPAPGVDATLLISGVLPKGSLGAVSWIGLVLTAFAAAARGRHRPWRAALLVSAACLNPLTLHACASGWGLGAAALFVFAARLESLPDRPVHIGLPVFGAGVLLAAAAVPGSASLGLPLFTVLFLAAPQPWEKGTMRSLYLTAFTLPTAWFGVLTYLAWQTGAAGVAAVSVYGSDIWHALLGGSLAVFCAPGLLANARRRPSGAAIIGLATLAFIAPGVPPIAGPLLASFGQLIAAGRDGSSPAAGWCLLGVGGTAASIWLLA